MRLPAYAALAALLVSVPLAAHAKDLGPGYHAYPIHFDGPMVRHGDGHGPSDTTGNLPNFDVTYHGGPVQTSTTSYTIYWQPKGTVFDPSVPPLINRFFKDVGGSAIYGMATTYWGSNGYVKNKSTFGGTYKATDPYPTGGITDNDLQAEVLKVAQENHWKPGISTQFFIYTAKGAIPANFCAYHSAFDYGLPPQHYIYGVIPYLGTVNGCNEPFGITPNNNPEADGLILNMSHEQMEMVTDPLINAWYDDHNGEVGDICIYSFGVPIANSGANIVIGKDGYFLQEDYSQAKGSCQPNL